MTKTLTEQWREGTLSMGYYYVSRPTRYGGEAIKYLDDDCSFGLGEDIIQEVLAPVPSYKTWKAFQQHFVDKTELEVKLKKAYEQLEQQSIKVVELQEQLHLREHLFLRIKPFLYKQDIPADILEELNELEESKTRRDK